MSNNGKDAHAVLRHEAAGSGLLLMAAVIALILANSPMSFLYDGLLGTPVALRAGTFSIDKPLLLWINDGLMAVFFFLVGLEIKRELLAGELSSMKQASLPLVAAMGGMLVPTTIYYAINSDNSAALRGWAIPSATDIAFAVGVLALLGTRIPVSLRIFLLALAIIDDLGAIVIIAIFYTADLSASALALAAAGSMALAILNVRGVTRIAPYILVGVLVWVCVLKSGVHATLAGVLTALAVPLRGLDGIDGADSPAAYLEASLHPWVAFGVLPIFAFANAGVSLSGVTIGKLGEGIPAGIALGLLLGKPIGVLIFSALAIKLDISQMPDGVAWPQLAGAGMLAGIGFTMSLFMGILAFPEPQYAADIRIGVLAGSVASAILGYTWLRWHSGDAVPAAARNRTR